MSGNLNLALFRVRPTPACTGHASRLALPLPCFFHVYGNRPLSAQAARAAVGPAKRIQKLSTTINVQIVDGQEVFGRHADSMPSQPLLAGFAPGHSPRNELGVIQADFLPRAR